MIVIDQLEKKFENTVALQNVSLTIEKGRIMGVVGSNGAGKSTLLRCISGVFQPAGPAGGLGGVCPGV